MSQRLQESSLTMSNSLDKISLFEEMSLADVYESEAKSRVSDDSYEGREEAISNERIRINEDILGTYVVTSEAISGGMGSVWRVHHRGWNIDLAMKRPQPAFFAEGSEKRKKAFVQECENWIRLVLHPCVVSCYYVREIGGVPTIFSEWMETAVFGTGSGMILCISGPSAKCRRGSLTLRSSRQEGCSIPMSTGCSIRT